MSEKELFHVTAEITVELTVQDIDDIMVSALEGGITYWCCEAEVVGEYLGEYGSDQISRGGSLILHDNEGDDKWELTLEKFLNGVAMYLKEVGTAALDCGHIDPGQIDGEAADCIVQFAIFGEVVYG